MQLRVKVTTRLGEHAKKQINFSADGKPAEEAVGSHASQAYHGSSPQIQ